MLDEPWRGFLPADVRQANEPVFHYTDSTGLLGIVQDKVLWATEASGLNDVAEVVQGWDFIRTWLETRDSRDEVTEDVLEVAVGDGSNDDNDPVRSREGVYVCSASLLGDDANQWRLYGGEARGYAVEFNPGIPLVPFAEGNRPERLPQRIGNQEFWVDPPLPTRVTPWLHVLYTGREKTAALDGLAANLKAERERLDAQVFAGKLDPTGEQVERKMLEVTLREDLALLARLMKSPGFAGEHEVRMIASEATSNVARFRGSPRGVVRYSRLVTAPSNVQLAQVVYSDEHPPENWTSLPIRSVRIGPLVRTSNNWGTIKALLANHPDSPKVMASSVPLGA